MTPEPVKALASWTCVWCGAALVAEDGVWTDEATGSGDYCSEGRAVGKTGTSPHLPADPAALLSPRVALIDDIRRNIEQRDHDYSLHLETVSNADDWTEADMTIYAATVGGVLALLDEIRAAILNRDTGSAEPEPEYTYDASCPHCRAGTPHHPIEAATEPTPETKE